ncbi:hypothetical protein Goklo_029415, partial [Gossypium klotzschianum]|nr:hypothetical protein [Gossypium klotzschianum]
KASISSFTTHPQFLRFKPIDANPTHLQPAIPHAVTPMGHGFTTQMRDLIDTTRYQHWYFPDLSVSKLVNLKQIRPSSIFNSAGFVGDSLNRNMFVSLFCTLKRVSNDVKKWRPARADRGFTFLHYNLTIGDSRHRNGKPDSWSKAALKEEMPRRFHVNLAICKGKFVWESEQNMLCTKLTTQGWMNSIDKRRASVSLTETR